MLAATYTEEQIRRAWVLRLNDDTDINELIYALRKLRKDAHVHDWADSDTITVKELREAWKRQFPHGWDWKISKAEHVQALNAFLRDISEHREPEYPIGTVVKDVKGKFWRLASYRFWESFGMTATVLYHIPERPLKVVS